MAHRVRTRLHGRKTYFNINQHVNYTNICIYSCKFCAFAAKEGEERAYLMTPQIVEQKVREQLHRPVTEVHMVAGIHPTMGYDYYLDVVRAAKRARPDIHVKAFTMVEIEHMLNISGKSEAEVFADLRQAGLGSCPAAAPRCWSTACTRRCSATRWAPTAGSPLPGRCSSTASR